MAWSFGLGRLRRLSRLRRLARRRVLRYGHRNWLWNEHPGWLLRRHDCWRRWIRSCVDVHVCILWPPVPPIECSDHDHGEQDANSQVKAEGVIACCDALRCEIVV